MKKAIIFDMDGLLVDSEPLWTRAEIEIFGQVGIELDEHECSWTVGMGLEEVVEFRFANKPWQDRSKQDIAASIHRRVAELIRNEARPMPGALRALELVREAGLKVGLATASDMVLVDAALERLGIPKAFAFIQSASGLPRGKPHPEVYLRAAAGLAEEPESCIGVEDSLPGLVAVKAARMTAIAVPEPRLKGDPRFTLADLVLDSLDELDAGLLEKLC